MTSLRSRINPPTETPPLVSHTSTVRVRYADTDRMGIVHHARYLEYFELGRSDLIRSLGMSYAQLEEKGIYLPVLEVGATYKNAANYDELILVQSSIYEFPRATLSIWYKILNEDSSQLLVEGYTIHGFLNAETKRLMRAPKEFLELFSHQQ